MRDTLSGAAFVDFYKRQYNSETISGVAFKVEISDEEAIKVYKQLLHWYQLVWNDETQKLLPNEEFLLYLSSDWNSAWNPDFKKIYQSMNEPLTSYFISSSHNTYLNQDQLIGATTGFSYTKALLMGARCVELDIWDGSDGEPRITHGHTLVGEITFKEAVYAINEIAWHSSEYPIILSFENHCCLDQQRVMAQFLFECFEDNLLTKPVSVNDPQYLPNPNQLKYKIIIKNKKGKFEGKENPNESSGEISRTNFNNPLCNALNFRIIFAGRLYIKDKDGLMQPCFAMITIKQDLIYTEDMEFDVQDGVISRSETTSENENSENKWSLLKSFLQNYRFNSSWFFGSDVPLSRYFAGDVENSELVKQWCLKNQHYGDGAFFIYASHEYANGLEMSVLYKKNIVVYLIKYNQEHSVYSIHCIPEQHENIEKEKNTTWIRVPQSEEFENLNQLIDHHREYPILLPDGENTITLTEPLPSILDKEPYFYESMDREQARKYLMEAGLVGAYLVRKRSLELLKSDPNQLRISYKGHNELRHISVIKKEFGGYIIEGNNFRSISDYLEKYSNKFLYPITPKSISTLALLSQSYRSLINGEKAIYKGVVPGVMKRFSSLYILFKNEQENGKTLMTLRKVNNSYHRPCVREFYVDDKDSWLNLYDQLKKEPKSIKNKEREHGKTPRDLSDLVIYCQAIHYKSTNENLGPEIVSSFTNTKILNDLVKVSNMSPYKPTEASKNFARYTQRHFARVYPNGLHINSYNYDPTGCWAVGCQMVALNFQTGDRGMHLNKGRFMDNGGCGYVLRTTSPLQAPSKENAKISKFQLEILGGINLPYSEHGILEFELVNEPWDPIPLIKYRVACNGTLSMFPKSQKPIKFATINPMFALIRFIYSSYETFYNNEGSLQGLISLEQGKYLWGDSNGSILAQTCVPVHGLLTRSVRSVEMFNTYGTPLAQCCLFVRVSRDGETAYSHERKDFINFIVDEATPEFSKKVII